MGNPCAQSIFPGIQESLEVFSRYDCDPIHRAAIDELTLDEPVAVLARDFDNIGVSILAALLVILSTLIHLT